MQSSWNVACATFTGAVAGNDGSLSTSVLEDSRVEPIEHVEEDVRSIITGDDILRDLGMVVPYEEQEARRVRNATWGSFVSRGTYSDQAMDGVIGRDTVDLARPVLAPLEDATFSRDANGVGSGRLPPAGCGVASTGSRDLVMGSHSFASGVAPPSAGGVAPLFALQSGCSGSAQNLCLRLESVSCKRVMLLSAGPVWLSVHRVVWNM